MLASVLMKRAAIYSIVWYFYQSSACVHGHNYLGKEAASGVYLVFVVNDDATQKLVGKFVLVR